MRSFLFISFLVVVCSSCNYMGMNRIRGNGKVVTRNIPTAAFNSIHVMGAVDVQLTQASEASASVETDENLIQYLDIYNDGNTLVVKTKQGYNLNPTKKVVVHASAPVFTEIKSSGSGVITTKNSINSTSPMLVDISGSGEIDLQVNVPQLTTNVSGSGTVAVKGSAKNYAASIDGSGDIKGFDLATEQTQVELSGSADAEVSASKNLEVKISGSGSVQYKGNPVIKQNISGSGSVEKAG